MEYWLCPGSLEKYDFELAFSELGTIDWRNKRKSKLKVGDVVFIYSSGKRSKGLGVIRLKTVVTRIDITLSEKIDDSPYYKELDYVDNYVRLQLLESYDTDLLAYKFLKMHSLSSTIQGFERVKPELLQYILHSIEEVKIEIDLELSEQSKQLEDLQEGRIFQVVSTRHERNPKAREECLEYHGYSCMVCSMNFNDVYGEFGKEFIHVHHLTPLSEIKETYIVNPIKDLIPVCPNCHAMIHKGMPLNFFKKTK